ncbi:hypothetical protein DFH09DRAFT_1315756 [Mycena vulgaris]|nr:hypothetical protein DFH09DRAFT_1315756 [Mycena vulgaris]
MKVASPPHLPPPHLRALYPVAIDELLRLPAAYRAAVLRIAAKMGLDIFRLLQHNEKNTTAPGLETITDDGLYCRIPRLPTHFELSNSMGLLLQTRTSRATSARTSRSAARRCTALRVAHMLSAMLLDAPAFRDAPEALDYLRTLKN